MGNYYEVSGSTITKYYYAGASRVAMNVNGVVSYLMTDQLGSTSVTADGSGNRTSELRYKAWGEVRYSYQQTPTKYTYTGQYSDSYINLLDNGSRRYDPELGRFLQPDSIVPDASSSQGYDRYAFVYNNPLKYTDPSGHKPCWATAHYSCDLSSWDKDKADAEVAKYSSKDQTSVVAFFRSHGVPVSGRGNSNANAGLKLFNSPRTTADMVTDIGGAFMPFPPSNYDNPLGSDEDPNPPIYGLVATALAVHVTVMAIDVLAVVAEAALFYSGADAAVPELALPLALTIGCVGVAALDFDVAFAAYTYRVASNPDVHQDFILLPPWGLRVP